MSSALLGPLRPATRLPGGKWRAFGSLRTAASLLTADPQSTRDTDKWRLVEYQDGNAILCNTWSTPQMSGLAFYYYMGDFKTWDEWDISDRGADLYVRVDHDPESLAISLPISLPDFPGEDSPECRTCEHFETYHTQGIDNAPMDAGACLAGDRARPANGLNDSCELYAASTL